MQTFLAWLSDNYLDLPSDSETLDDLLTEWLHFLFASKKGVGKSTGANAVYGLGMFLPNTRSKLQTAKLALRGWNKLIPPKPYPPISWPLTCLVAASMAAHGDALAAVATLVAFDALLRVGELVALRRNDIVLPDSKRLGVQVKEAALRLKVTKTRTDLWAAVPNKDVESLLTAVCQHLALNDRVFPFTAAQFRYKFKSHCSLLGLPNFVPHSLRHGSATRLYMLKTPLSEILLRGRWAATKSAEHYIQAGRSLMIDLDIGADVLHHAEALAADLLGAFSLAQRLFERDGV